MVDIEDIHPWGHATGDLGLVHEKLDQPSDAVVAAFNGFGAEFQSNVMKYTVESEIQYDLLSRLKRRLDPSPVRIYGRVVSIPNQYKAPYARGFTRGVQSDAIHAEVNIGTSSEFEIDDIPDQSSSDGVDGLFEILDSGANSARLDIAQLRPRRHPLFDTDNELSAEENEYWRLSGINGRHRDAVEVAISNGSKFFPPSAVRRAIEVKYIKDMSTSGGYTDPYESKDDEDEWLPDDVHAVPWDEVESDVEKLYKLRETLASSDTDRVPAHLVIVTNYDPFRLAAHRTDDDEENKDRLGTSGEDPPYPKQFERLVEVCARLGIHVWVYYPQKIYRSDKPSNE